MWVSGWEEAGDEGTEGIWMGALSVSATVVEQGAEEGLGRPGVWKTP